MADEDDPYFGYNENSLEPGYVAPPFLPGYKPPANPFISKPPAFYYSDGWKGNDNGRGDDNGAAGGDSSGQIDNADIDVINKWIMGEQPGTTAERAQQWSNVAQLLQDTAQALHDQTQTLAEHWESPGAKAVFLEKVGMTLAYLRVWEDAAIKNSVALHGLSNVMYEAQAEMRVLYQEYAAVTGALQYLADQPGVGTQYGYYKVMPQRKVDETKDEYTDKARKLAHKYAGEYSPYIATLQAGHAKALDPINAIAHPEALGVDLPDVPPPGAPPGAPGGPPPGAPPGGPNGAPPGGPKNRTPPTGTPPGGPKHPPKNFTNRPPGPGGPKTPPGTPPAAPPPAPKNLVPPGTPPPATPPAPAPATPPPGTPPPAFAGLPPGLLPNGFRGGKIPPASFGGNKPSPGLFDGSKAPNAAPPTLGSTSPDTSAGAPPGGFPSSSAPNSLYPPGTITPPPGGQVPENPKEKSPGANQPGIPSYGEQSFTDHLEMEAKSAAQQQASAAPPPSLPPGSSAPGSTAGEKTGSPSGLPGHTEQSPAFQAPPSTTPPVLGNDKKRKQRAGSKAEAPAVPQDGPGLGAPPVLSNPHRKPPEKTFTEKQRERKRAPRPAVPGSEFAANLPAGIAPVFDGRFSTEEYVVGPAGEIPSVLQAAAPVVSAPDRHAKPVVHADRATRVAKPAEKTPVREDTAFEVETPGGPVVAGGQEERRQSPAGPSPLDGRT